MLRLALGVASAILTIMVVVAIATPEFESAVADPFAPIPTATESTTTSTTTTTPTTTSFTLPPLPTIPTTPAPTTPSTPLPPQITVPTLPPVPPPPEPQATTPPVVTTVSPPPPDTTVPPPPPAPSGVEQWRSTVALYFSTAHVEIALCIMGHESGGNPDANNPNSSAAGLFQFLRSTWDDMVPSDVTGGSYDSGQVYVPEANIRAAAWLAGNVGWSQWSPWNRGLCH